ncbi:MAG: S-layer homology domain-containing protein, partial [Clostridia bacterium]|nr:S-layer homology domain-containing protein [Clostridia bacterium]
MKNSFRIALTALTAVLLTVFFALNTAAFSPPYHGEGSPGASSCKLAVSPDVTTDREDELPKVWITGEEPRGNADAVFSDVPASAWFAPYVNYAYKNGLMNGVSATRFDPGGITGRAMIVTVLWRAEGSPAPAGASPFGDLTDGWYRDAVVWAAENGIVNGKAKGIFSPRDPLTREQFAAIMMRFSTYKGRDVSDRADLSRFPDAAQTDGYAVEPMRWAVGSGLVTGSSRNGKIYLDPLGHATRGQVAAILNRYLEGDAGSATLTVDRGAR